MAISLFRRHVVVAAAALSSLAAAPSVLAQSSPPLRVILPVGAGSGVDVIVRSAQTALSKALGGQAVVIENLPGAGGLTGTQALVNAAPDGNTVAFISNNHSVNPSVFKKMPYDSLADITPISLVGGSPFVLVVNPNTVPAKTAKELQTFLKAKPDAYSYGSSGNGTILHLAAAMYVDAADVQVKHIPYKGLGPMVTDVIGGQIELGVSALGPVMGHLASGKLRAIGVTGKQRVSALPDVPTIAEQGFPSVDVAGWIALVGPKGLSEEQVKRLHAVVSAAFNDPEVKAGFAKRNDFLALTSPPEATAFLRTEQARYADLVKKAGLTPN